MSPESFAAFTGLFPDPALLLAREGTVLATNTAAEQLGARAGRPLAELVTSPDAWADYLRVCARSGSSVPGAVSFRGPDGRVVPFRAAGRLVRPAGCGGGALIAVRLVRKEAAVAQFVALTERVEQLTREVARRKQVEAELLAAARHKDEFLAMLAHELRNPLPPILNGVDVLRLRGDDAPTRERALGMIGRQARHLSQMVNELLDVARLAQGKVRLACERHDLGRLVADAVSDHREGCDRNRITLSVEAPPTPVWVSADLTRLNQVVANLLVNACKFTEADGKVEVRVRAAGERAEVSVRDDGAGIDPDMLPSLFEPFRQADRTLDRAKGGLGLGLAVAKRLTELHGGGIAASSEGPGRGSEFTFWLPLEPEPAPLTGPPAPGPGGRRRVLVIEDNLDSADSLRMLLEAFGYEVRVAYNGPDGVREADQWRPDAVVCDIGLPGLDGYGVAAELGRLSVRSTARLIALTGYGDEESRLRSSQAGFHHHLTKPADPTTLQKLLAG